MTQIADQKYGMYDSAPTFLPNVTQGQSHNSAYADIIELIDACKDSKKEKETVQRKNTFSDFMGNDDKKAIIDILNFSDIDKTNPDRILRYKDLYVTGITDSSSVKAMAVETFDDPVFKFYGEHYKVLGFSAVLLNGSTDTVSGNSTKATLWYNKFKTFYDNAFCGSVLVKNKRIARIQVDGVSYYGYPVTFTSTINSVNSYLVNISFSFFLVKEQLSVENIDGSVLKLSSRDTKYLAALRAAQALYEIYIKIYSALIGTLSNLDYSVTDSKTELLPINMLTGRFMDYDLCTAGQTFIQRAICGEKISPNNHIDITGEYCIKDIVYNVTREFIDALNFKEFDDIFFKKYSGESVDKYKEELKKFNYPIDLTGLLPYYSTLGGGYRPVTGDDISTVRTRSGMDGETATYYKLNLSGGKLWDGDPLNGPPITIPDVSPKMLYISTAVLKNNTDSSKKKEVEALLESALSDVNMISVDKLNRKVLYLTERLKWIKNEILKLEKKLQEIKDGDALPT